MSDKMDATTDHTPVSAVAPLRRFVDADDELVLYMHKRVIAQYATNEYGATELRLYYGPKEISFDEPDLFAFGETLAKQTRFIAKAATAWGNGYDWPRIQGLLEQLIEEGVLHRGEYLPESLDFSPPDGDMPSPLPPALITVPRTWFESEAVTQDLAGRPLELGYLELVIPIFRVAHMSMDADGRQVGEANVFPASLRLDVPTNWRRCIYPGSRYLAAQPMNVTALKAMRAHWGPMMAMLLRIREGYFQRFPEARKGWTVGHLERLSTVVLALPTYALMRVHGGVENGQLHPALSSLFRVTDGLRMTMHQMLFIPIGEPTVSPDAPISSDEIYAYAERNYAFHSEHGVCAGPTMMIKEFFSVIVDGKPARGAESVVLEPALEATLGDLDAAIDYGLYGLQAYAAIFSLWPIMTRTYERLWKIADGWPAGRTQKATAFVDRLREKNDSMVAGTFLAKEQWRADRQHVYEDMYVQCAAGLRNGAAPVSLSEQIAPDRLPRPLQTEQQLRVILQRHFEFAANAGSTHLNDLVACLMDYVTQEQAILRVACATQRHINALLGRTPPARPFTAREIDIHLQLQGVEARKTRLPYLIDELQEIFGIRMTIDKDHIEIVGAAHTRSTRSVA
jgi:hypothetical protein